MVAVVVVVSFNLYSTISVLDKTYKEEQLTLVCDNCELANHCRVTKCASCATTLRKASDDGEGKAAK